MQANNIVVIGKTGSGKSVKVQNLTRDDSRILFFDTLGHDYQNGIVFYTIEDLKKFWLKCYKGRFRLIYRPLDESAEFPEICELVYLCGNMTLVAEEIDLFFRPNGTHLSARNILRRGRHKGLKFIGVTQRPMQIDRNITAQATEAYIFETNEPRDIEYLSARFGMDTESYLKGLSKYEFLHVNPDGTKCTGRDTL